MTKKEPGAKLPPIGQVAIVVKDMDRAMDYYSSSFGWGPFQLVESELKGVSYRGQLSNCRLKLALTRSGPIIIELMQVLDDETPLVEFYREKEEGVHHLGFFVKDLDATLAELAKEGIKPVLHQRLPEFAFAFVDTSKTGGVMFELVELKKT